MKKKIYRHLSLFLATALLSACTEVEEVESKPRPVRTTEARALESHFDWMYPGLAKGVHEINLAFRVDGQLLERPAQVGMDATEGALLAQLDPKDFLLERDSLIGQLEQQRSELRRAQADFQRQQRIQREDPGATTQQIFDRTQQTFEAALASVISLEAELKVAENRIGYTKLEAPFDGRVMATFVENFAEVATGQEIVRLVDTSLVEMEVSLPERMMVELKNVNEIVVVFDLFPDHEIPARIKERGDEASAVTRTFPVTLIMDPPDDVMILPGMAGEATFRVRNRGQIGEGVLVPPSAVASDRYGRNYVFVFDPKASEVYQRGVEVEGLADDGMILRQGLKAGELVVSAGVHYLTEGQKVEVMK